MTGGVVCYVERTPGGVGIRRLRLIAAGLSRTWTAPEARPGGSLESGRADASAGPRTGAEWISETLASVGLRRLATVCVDTEGSICAWLSAPSADPKVIQATIASSSLEHEGSGAGVGAARLLALSEVGVGGDVSGSGNASIQALATVEPETSGSGRAGLTLSRRGKSAAVGSRQRYAVLAVPDAPVRVLLDALDAKGIEVDRVVSVWHALAMTWDTPRAGRAGSLEAESAPAAIIAVEPTGRLIWSWMRSGELVAGGSMRLSHAVSKPAADAVPPPLSPVESTEIAPVEPVVAASRRPAEEPETVAPLEFSTEDAGRLAMDWLSWSAQLGHCPRRVVCLTAANLQAGSRGPQGLLALLSRAWPGATIDGAIHEDPVGATLGRLAGLGNDADAAQLPRKDAGRSDVPLASRPREVLVGLSSRPGRADRRVYQWIAASLAAAAALVAALGYQVYRSLGDARARLQSARAEFQEVIKGAEKFSPNIAVEQRKEEALEDALRRIREQMKAIKPPRPVLQEAVRVVEAMSAVAVDPAVNAEGPRPMLTELDFSFMAAKVVLQVPDAQTGPTVLERLQGSAGVLPWQSTASGSGGNRTYTLFAGWPEDLSVRPPVRPRPEGGAAPAPTGQSVKPPTSGAKTADASGTGEEVGP